MTSDLDLDAIRERISCPSASLAVRIGEYEACARAIVERDAPALLAEVERLRGDHEATVARLDLVRDLLDRAQTYGPDEFGVFKRALREAVNAPREVVEGGADAERLHGKYRVTRTVDPDGKHTDCRYFVLDPGHDEHAVTAIRAYAAAVRVEQPALAADLDAWVGTRVTSWNVINRAAVAIYDCLDLNRAVLGDAHGIARRLAEAGLLAGRLTVTEEQRDGLVREVSLAHAAAWDDALECAAAPDAITDAMLAALGITVEEGS